MARRFAAVLGLVAFAVIMTRGIARGGALETAIGDAVVILFLFTLVGAIAGWIAEMIVAEAKNGKSNQAIRK